MFAYTVRRLFYMIPIILGVSILVFLLFSTVGEDPVRLALGNHATPEAIENLRHKWGLDQSLFLQYIDFLKQIINFDFGRSFTTGEKLSDMFINGAQISLALTVPPYIVGTFINIFISILIAYFRGTLFDKISTVVIVAALSISYLVYIIFAQYFFAYYLGWFPINGYEPGFASIEYLSLSWLIIIIVSAGPDIRVYRTVFLDETKADYVRTAFSKGCSQQVVMFKHILKNTMIPIITSTVIAIPFLILGSFLLERFFSIPGIGDILITAINNGDFPVIKGMTIIIAIGFSFFNLITDLLYAYVDPRIQLS